MIYKEVKCPQCGSNFVEQTRDHSSSGVNEYHCHECNLIWGN